MRPLNPSAPYVLELLYHLKASTVLEALRLIRSELARRFLNLIGRLGFLCKNLLWSYLHRHAPNCFRAPKWTSLQFSEALTTICRQLPLRRTSSFCLSFPSKGQEWTSSWFVWRYEIANLKSNRSALLMRLAEGSCQLSIRWCRDTPHFPNCRWSGFCQDGLKLQK